MNQLPDFDISTMDDAISIAHTLSSPSKIPGYAYSIPATACKIGSRLRSVKTSVCSSCYALKGRYVFPNVKNAMEKRLQSLTHPLWVNAMAFMINYFASPKRKEPCLYFRWHDSGDVQGIWHLEKIIEVCRLTPTVSHWMPTREITILREFVSQGGKLPDNLVVRVSAPIIGTRTKNTLGLPMSTVGLSDLPEEMVQCEAKSRGGICGSCRACWSEVDVNYPLH